MKLKTRTLGTIIGRALCLTAFIAALSACSSGNDAADPPNSPSQRSAALSFQLKLAPPPAKAAAGRAIGAPDICSDHRIDTITVQIHRSLDNTEAVSVQKDCAEHSMAIEEIPPSESMYMIVKAQSGIKTNWQRQVNDLVFDAGQTKDLGIVTLDYIGDDTTAPSIASKHPVPDAVGVDLKTWITVVFNEALAPSSIPDHAITVSNNDAPVPGKVGYDPVGHAVYFIPDNATGLDADTTYTATFQIPMDDKGGLTDIAGNSYTGDAQTWQFTTRGTDDTTAPQVIAASPTDGAKDVEQNIPLSVIFSEPMDPASITNGVFNLSSDHGAINVELAYDEQTRTLTLTPETLMEYATKYTAMISTDVKDLAKNPLGATYSWEFWTSLPVYELKTIKTGNGSGTIISTDDSGIVCGDTCQAVFPAGTTVNLKALTDETSEFTGWSGSVCNGGTWQCTITLTNNTILVADFTLRTYTISTSVVPADGSGGAINPTNAIVNHGDNQSIDILPNPFHSLIELDVDGSEVTPTVSYLFDKISDNHTLQAVFRSNTINLTNDPNRWDGNPHINNTGHLVWQSQNENSTDIYYLDGSHGSNATNLTKTHNLPGWHSRPQINDSGHVVWQGDVDGAAIGNDIFYYDGSVVHNITKDVPGTHRWPKINNSGQVVWLRYLDKFYDIYYFDNSSGAKKISENQVSSGAEPEINDNGHVVWSGKSDVFSSDQEIYYYDGSTAEIVSEYHENPNSFPGKHYAPQINNNGHVIWINIKNDNSNKEIYYYDGTNITLIPDSYIADITTLQINGNGHVVWSGGTNNDIYYSKGPTPPKNISNFLGQWDTSPQINANGHVVWWGGKNDEVNEVYYYDGSDVMKISKNPVVTYAPGDYNWVVRINDQGHVVWQHPIEYDGNYDIFHSTY